MKLHIGRFLFLTWHHLQYCRCWKKTFNKELNYFHSWQYPRWSWKWFALAPSGEWNIFMVAFPRPQLKFSICCFRGTKMLGPNWTNWNIVQQVYKYKNTTHDSVGHCTLHHQKFLRSIEYSHLLSRTLARPVLRLTLGLAGSALRLSPGHKRRLPGSKSCWITIWEKIWKQIMLNNNLGAMLNNNLEANNVE